MTPRRVSPMAAAVLLTAMLGASGQAPPQISQGPGQQTVQAQPPGQQSTRTTPTPPSYARQIAEKVGRSGGNPGQHRNLNRQARRVLERIGVIDSGRQWRKFRRASRTNPLHADLWQLALYFAKHRIPLGDIA